MRELADLFKALSDETRLQMIALLLDNDELCVCDFVEALGITQSKASRHLRYLYNAGLLRDRREGLWTHYRLVADPTIEQEALLESLDRAISAEQRQELRQRLVDWMKSKKSGTCV
jgi:ArsR family transcriptional regulator